MDRRTFLQISTLAAAGLRIQEGFAMQTPSQGATASATIILPEEGHIYSQMGSWEARLLMTGDKSEGAWWMGHFREDPGFLTLLHYHPKTDEQFYVLDGVLSFYFDGVWHELGPGTLVVVPHGKAHAQGNRSGKPVYFLGSGAPAGVENLLPAVDALLKRLKPGTSEFAAEFQKIEASCDMVSLGPAPS
jgi:mannose-6-phosphate isomerase-like protein (cupin superfamily)